MSILPQFKKRKLRIFTKVTGGISTELELGSWASPCFFLGITPMLCSLIMTPVQSSHLQIPDPFGDGFLCCFCSFWSL